MLDGDWPVYRKAADGTGKEELLFRYTPGAFVGLSDISADGKFLVCDSGGVVLLVPLDGDLAARKPVDYLRDEFDNGTGRLSLDGHFFAYRSDEANPNATRFYVRPFDAAKPLEDRNGRCRRMACSSLRISCRDAAAVAATTAKRFTSAVRNWIPTIW